MDAVSAGRRVVTEAISQVNRHIEDFIGYDWQYKPMHIMDGIDMVWGAIRDLFPKLNR